MRALKPCPFCGSPETELTTDGDGTPSVICIGCSADYFCNGYLESEGHERATINGWNRRAPSPAVREFVHWFDNLLDEHNHSGFVLNPRMLHAANLIAARERLREEEGL